MIGSCDICFYIFFDSTDKIKHEIIRDTCGTQMGSCLDRNRVVSWGCIGLQAVSSSSLLT